MDLNNDKKNLKKIDIIDLVAVLYQNKIKIALITIGFMVFSVLFNIYAMRTNPRTSPMPDVYTSKATVFLNDPGSGSSGGISAGALGSLAGIPGLGGGGGESADSLLAIKLSTTKKFITDLDKTFNLSEVYNLIGQKNQYTWLEFYVRSRLTITPDPTIGILEISYTDVDKNLATNIVNKVTDLLDEQFTKINSTRNSTQLKTIEEKKLQVEKEITIIEDKITALQNKYNIIHVETLSTELTRQVILLRNQLMEKQMEIDSYQRMTKIKDAGFMRLMHEKESIERAIKMVEEGEVGKYPPLDEIPEISLTFEHLKREMDVQLTIYKTLIQQQENLKLKKDGKEHSFQIFEYGDVPEVKSGPSRGKFCMTLSIGGFFFSIFFVFFLQGLKTLFNNKEMISRIRGKKA